MTTTRPQTPRMGTKTPRHGATPGSTLPGRPQPRPEPRPATVPPPSKLIRSAEKHGSDRRPGVRRTPKPTE
jgi:hypothetical protein